MPRSGCSALHGVNPNLKKIELFQFRSSLVFRNRCHFGSQGSPCKLRDIKCNELEFDNQRLVTYTRETDEISS